jgi:hypothetical protein
MMRAAAISAALFALVGCYRSADKFRHDPDAHTTDATDTAWVADGLPEPDCPGGTRTEVLASAQVRPVDVLVVMDNSLSMAEEQDDLSKKFSHLISAILGPAVDPMTGLPLHTPVTDLHIGVLSTDMGTGGYSVETCSDPIDGDNGELQHTASSALAGCDDAYPTYLSYASAEPDPDAIAWMSGAFECIVLLGIDGCGFEQHLKSMEKGLVDQRDAYNAGFLRDHSVLVVLFVTDEEDCSIAPGCDHIFDATDSSLGHLNLRCFRHPELITPVEHYIDVLRSLRSDPEDLVVGFIVGVPQVPECEGYGDEIPDCLDHPDMIETVDPIRMTTLLPSCVSSTGRGTPARRFVTIAQAFGDQAHVSSICADDFTPAIGSLTSKLQEHFVLPERGVAPLDVHTGSDPCVCLVDCRMIEVLADMRPCDAVGKPCYEPDGPGTGCAEPLVDPSGISHSVCEIPQAGTMVLPCEPTEPMSCDAPAIAHTPAGEGWYYMDEGWIDASGAVAPSPTVRFTPGYDLEPYSTAYLNCCI